MAAVSSQKRWAAEHLVGVENVLIPSFTPDLQSLDEAGIRWDVRHSIEQGFASTMCAPEAGLNLDEAHRFLEVAVDEAGDEIHVSTTLLFDSMDMNREILQHADEVGLDTVLLGYPLSWYPDSEEEVYQVTRDLCESVDLGVVLYPTAKFTFDRFHPSGFPIGILDRLADIPNVVGVKVSSSGPGNALVGDEVFRMVGDRLQVTHPAGEIPGLVRLYGMQWLAGGPHGVYQTPESPYFVEYFDHLLAGNYDEAMAIYWKLSPIRTTLQQQMRPQKELGNYHFSQLKYYQWLTGGNGGYTRQPAMPIPEQQKKAMRRAMRSVGLDVRENDAEFYVGRVNHADETRM